MTWIIKRDEPAKNGHATYVNQPGSHNSYTCNKLKARTFPSREAALKECCGNERPVELR